MTDASMAPPPAVRWAIEVTVLLDSLPVEELTLSLVIDDQ